MKLYAYTATFVKEGATKEVPVYGQSLANAARKAADKEDTYGELVKLEKANTVIL